jgi:hypothetical protein
LLTPLNFFSPASISLSNSSVSRRASQLRKVLSMSPVLVSKLA